MRSKDVRECSTVGNVAIRLLYSWDMTERTLTVPQILFIGGTRVALGAGIGLLLAGRLNRDARQAGGLALLAFGAITTVPIVLGILWQGARAPKRIILA